MRNTFAVAVLAATLAVPAYPQSTTAPPTTTAVATETTAVVVAGAVVDCG